MFDPITDTPIITDDFISYGSNLLFDDTTELAAISFHKPKYPQSDTLVQNLL